VLLVFKTPKNRIGCEKMLFQTNFPIGAVIATPLNAKLIADFIALFIYIKLLSCFVV